MWALWEEQATKHLMQSGQQLHKQDSLAIALVIKTIVWIAPFSTLKSPVSHMCSWTHVLLVQWKASTLRWLFALEEISFPWLLPEEDQLWSAARPVKKTMQEKKNNSPTQTARRSKHWTLAALQWGKTAFKYKLHCVRFFFYRQNFTWAKSHLKVEGISNNTLLQTVHSMLIQSYSPPTPHAVRHHLENHFKRGYLWNMNNMKYVILLLRCTMGLSGAFEKHSSAKECFFFLVQTLTCLAA